MARAKVLVMTPKATGEGPGGRHWDTKKNKFVGNVTNVPPKRRTRAAKPLEEPSSHEEPAYKLRELDDIGHAVKNLVKVSAAGIIDIGYAVRNIVKGIMVIAVVLIGMIVMLAVHMN